MTGGADGRASSRDWLTRQVQTAKDPEYATRVLARVALGMRGGGAVRGVRILAGPDSCAACRAAAGVAYDPDDAPRIPLADCIASSGCRCAYATVMLYESEQTWPADHRPKGPGYAAPILERLRVGARARGAIGGVRVVSAADACPTCRNVAGVTYRAEDAPAIPVAGCSGPLGCRCAYTPAPAYELPAPPVAGVAAGA